MNGDRNEAGVYGVTFYIRGKPWVVSVDDYMLFRGTQPPYSLKFSKQSRDDLAIWGPVLEKAWAKVRGNFINVDGGVVKNGLRLLTGVPVFTYATNAITTQTALTEAFDRIKQADEANWIMAATTEGTEGETNACGLVNSHSFTIIHSFTMIDADNI